jgi:hypothetical protein
MKTQLPELPTAKARTKRQSGINPISLLLSIGKMDAPRLYTLDFTSLAVEDEFLLPVSCI